MTIDLMGKEKFICQRQPSKVTAYRAEKMERVTIRSGEIMIARIGDWVIEQYDDRWVCEHDMFHSLYEIVGPLT